MGSYFLLQGNLPDLGIEPESPALQADALPSEPQMNHWYINMAWYGNLPSGFEKYLTSRLKRETSEKLKSTFYFKLLNLL